MRTRYIPTMLATVAFALLAFAPTAFAAPVDFETLDVTIHSEGASAVMLVTGTLPENTPLPAQVEVAVPTGGELQWAGEILGGDPSADPSVSPQVKTVGDNDIYSFTLTKARIGQVEVVGPAFFRFDGTENSGTLAWTPVRDLESLRLSVLVPTGGQITTITPGAQVLAGPQGSTYVDKIFPDAKAGEEVMMSLKYATAPAGAASAPASSDATTPVIIVLLIAVAGAILMIFAVNRKMRTRTVYADEDEDEDYAFAEETEEPTAPKAKTRKPAQQKAPEPVSPRRSKAAVIITGTVIVAAVAAGAFASQTSSSVTETPEGFVQEFAQGDPCDSVTFELLGTPSKSDAEKLFEAVKPAGPLSAVAYTENPRVEFVFCASTTTAEAIQGAVATTGLIGKVIPKGPAPVVP